MNKMIKKITAVALTAVMVGGLFAGCSQGAKEPTATSDVSSTEKKTYTVGICQLVQHPALDEATKGFKDALRKEFGDSVVIKEQNAANDSATCATICNGFVSENVDLIMANATPALQAAMTATSTIPILGTSVTDYATALSIKDWKGTTGINVSGTADLAPLAEQAKMVKEICPDAKKVAILYCSAEPNSVYQAKVVSEELTKLGIESKEFTAADSNDVASVTQTACDWGDALYIPTDNVMASSTGIIDPITSAAKKAVICGEEGIAKGCGVATLSISYYAIGKKTGEMAIEILKNGANPAEMEIAYDTTPVNKYVKDRATKLGLTIPDTYEEIDMTEEKE